MLKFNLRKLATVIISVAVAGMMAACSGASNTDEALSNEGSYMGTFRFDVNPQAQTEDGLVNVTEVGNPYSSHKINKYSSFISISTMPQGCFLANLQNNTAWAVVTGYSRNCTLTGANGTLAYVNTNSSLSWWAPTDTAAGTAVTIANGGTYRLQSATLNNAMTVYITQKPTANKSDANLNIQKARKWAGGTGTIDFNTKLEWTNPYNPYYELTNVRIGPRWSTDVNVKTTNSWHCTGTWSSCWSASTDPSITFVSDNSAEGPVTRRQCNWSGGGCYVAKMTNISAGCGSFMAHWTLVDTAATGYTFWSDLYGDLHSNAATAPEYFDPYTYSMFLRVHKVGTNTSVYPAEGAESNTMAPGEWFYVHYYVDYPGNNSNYPFDSTFGQGEKHMEDTGNIAAWAGGTNSSANYWFTGSITWSIRFDPAVVEINSINTNDGPGNGLNTFTTVKGTQMKVINDAQATPLADGFDVTSPIIGAQSNRAGFWYEQTTVFAAAKGFLPSPCGRRELGAATCNATDGYPDGVDLDLGYIALRIRTTAPSGSGSYIHPAWDSNLYPTAFLTLGKPYDSGYWQNDILAPRSAKWPAWCSYTANGSSCQTGNYNTDRTFVCVQ